jgi:hypothetical protein
MQFVLAEGLDGMTYPCLERPNIRLFGSAPSVLDEDFRHGIEEHS